jgi:E3 ubiquitin-protein ligase UBR2
VIIFYNKILFLFRLEDSGLDESDSAVMSSSEQTVIAIGNNRSPSITLPREQFICILCQENPSSNERPLVYSAYIQRSTLLSDDHNRKVEQGEEVDPLVSYRDQRVGTHVASCGHVMHGDCWQRFFESILANDRLSLRFRIRNTFDLTKREFLCPLCSGLGNTVLPMVACNAAVEESRYSTQLSQFTNDLYFENVVSCSMVCF